jgi:dynein intermediate chain
MSDRKAELERKKAKLAQIRAEKEARRKEREATEATTAAKAAVTGLKRDERQEIDRNLEALGITPVAQVVDTISSLPPSLSDASASSTPDTSLKPELGPSPRLKRRKAPQLSVVAVQTTNIPPKEQVTYSKNTQTLESGTDAIPARGSRGLGGFDYYTLAYDEPEDGYEEDSLPGLGSGSPSSGSPGAYLSKLPPGILPSGMPEVKDIKPATTKEEEEKKRKEEERKKKELSEEEKQVIMMGDNFQKFFDRATRIVERALSEDINVFVDYTGGYEDGEGLEDKTGGKLSMNRYFYDERWSKNRVITSLDWSQQFPELLCASYNNNQDAPHEPDGVCLVWNTRFKKDTPENIFHCQSPVMTAVFARFHPNLILGGTYSGQIVLWDNRHNKRTPVQRSPLSASAHTHPVYSARVVGTQNAHNLISISTDGKMCSWSLDMLAQPQETLELQHKQSKAVATTCLSFPQNDVNNFLVGSEEGTVYSACRHGSRAGVLDLYEGHQAPVTGLDTHPGQGTIDFSHLFLTSSIDWTVKLWSLKENKPLYSFEDNGMAPPACCSAVSTLRRRLRVRLCLVPDPPRTFRGGGRHRPARPLEPEQGHGGGERQRRDGGRRRPQQRHLDPVRPPRGRRGRPGQDLGLRRGGAAGRAAG